MIDRLLRSLTNITPTPEQVEDIVTIRSFAKDLARVIEDEAPNSREKSLAFTHLEETVMWAVKSILLGEQ